MWPDYDFAFSEMYLVMRCAASYTLQNAPKFHFWSYKSSLFLLFWACVFSIVHHKIQFLLQTTIACPSKALHEIKPDMIEDA